MQGRKYLWKKKKKRIEFWILLWHKSKRNIVISVISVPAMLDPNNIPSKSLRSKLIRDVSKASSTVIEEWWINVHAFDLAGHCGLI